MKRSLTIRAAGMFAVIGLFGALPARAADFPAPPAGATALDDSALAVIRGKFVPAVQTRVPASSALAQTNSLQGNDREPLPYQSGAAIRSPLSGLSDNGGPIVYFGVTMSSTWTVANNGVTQGVQIGANLNVDVRNRSVTVNTWSSAQNGGLPQGASTGNGVQGAPPASNISSGVGQSIQVAGNGNTISNSASVQYGTGGYTAATLPSSDGCGAPCSFQIGPNGFGIAITTPQGNVMQSIGPGGILQAAQIWSDLNTVTNQLGVTVQTSSTLPPNALSLPNGVQIIPILPSITGIP
jgi:hypothetical protein